MQKYNSRSYSNKKIQYLCKKKKTRFENGYAPWVNIESENSSYGKCFRKLALYPKFLPLFIFSDHGVSWNSKLSLREMNIKFPYFVWNKKVYLKLKKLNKEAYFIKHPWLFYKEKILNKKNIEKKRGTLVFYLHSNSHVKPIYNNLSDYIKKLKKLGDEYQPISIMLSYFDIQKKIHLKLRKLNVQIVTAGDIESRNFIDKFYSLITKFKYATSVKSSTTLGSHFFYCVNAGLSYFFMGGRIKTYNYSSEFSKKKYLKFSDYGDMEDVHKIKKIEKLFSIKKKSIAKKDFDLVNEFLGMNSNTSRIKIIYVVWKSFFKNIPLCFKIYLNYFFKEKFKIF